MADAALTLRFQPALLLILVGLFVVAIQASPGAEFLGFLTEVIQIDALVRPFCRSGPSWPVRSRRSTCPSYRVMGFAGAVYAFASIAWVLLLSTAAIVDTLLVMLATYALVIGALYATWFAGRRQAGRGTPRRRGGRAPFGDGCRHLP